MSAVPAPSRPAADRCPGVLRLHDAGDGPLARVRVPGGLLSASQLDALAAGAALGNGLAELTARASVQLRGLGGAPSAGGADAAALARVLAAGGLLPSAEHDRVRNVLASPLAGRTAASLLDTDPLVAAFDAALCADPSLAALPGRFLFALDDGAGLVDVAASDVALMAEAGAPPTTREVAPDARTGRDDDDGAGGPGASAGLGPGSRTRPASAVLRLSLAGAPTTATVPVAGAVDLLLAAARAFLALRAELDPTAWHVADLPDGAARLAAALGASPLTADLAPHGRAKLAVIPPGRHVQPDGRVALTALVPLARLERGQLAGLAELLRGLGPAPLLRLSAARTLTLADLAPDRAADAERALAQLGLVTAAGSGWQGLTACSGLGACRRARVDVRAAATARATRRRPGAPAEHWSACPRRCGMKRDVALGVVAEEDGTVALSRTGRPWSAAPDLAAALALLDHDTTERPAA